MKIDQILSSRYVKHGRELPDLDCYGLVRLVWSEVLGKPELPSYSHVDPDDKGLLTESAMAVKQGLGFAQAEVRHGVIALAWRGRKCVHIGVVLSIDGRMWVLETDESTGPVLTDVKIFESRYSLVQYYDN